MSLARETQTTQAVNKPKETFYVRTTNLIILTLFKLSGLRDSRFHSVLALHDLSEPKGDVLEMVWLGCLGFTISFELRITED